MKTLWNILSIVAVANFIAIVGFVGWLANSGRLNIDRARAFKEVLVETVSDAKAREDADTAKKAEEATAAAAKAKEARPPMTAQEKLAARLEATELDMQRFKKLQSDIEAMQTNLRAQAEALATERAAFDKDKAAFEARRKEVENKSDDVQFKKSLAILEGMDAKNAVATLRQILTGVAPSSLGAAPNTDGTAKTGEDLGLRYLNGMSPSKRTELINLLAKADPGLAANLLDKLRTFGLPPKPSGNLTQ